MIRRLGVILLLAALPSPGWGQEAQNGPKAREAEARRAPPADRNPVVPPDRYHLVEPFTANILPEGQAKMGLINFDLGVGREMMLGTDFLADIIGAPNAKAKVKVVRWGDHDFAFGLKGVYLNRNTILWGSVKDHFEKLEAKIISPSLSVTSRMSQRLNIHTHWSTGIGKIEAELTEKGKRKLWETKHPGGEYNSRETNDDQDEDDGETDSSENQEKSKSKDKPASFKQRLLLFSSVTGMVNDTFQITGEYERKGGNKVLITSRVERTSIEDLKVDNFRFTAAQQWIWEHFQIRFGIGLQYLVITGTDLDGEEIDEAGILPASDIDFYWRF